jgi:two-component system phosphate regulon response regulator OmpR
MAEQAHILVVDDEVAVRSMLQQYLQRHGFAVSLAANGAAMRQALSKARVDLVVLDIRMPGEDGIALARHLRGGGSGPAIIFLTASGETIDRIVGLEIGADDYLPKPFDPRELLARIRCVLRRSHPAESASSAQEVRFGRCRLNLQSRRLYEVEGGEVAVTPMELDMLEAFARHPNQILSRDQLLGVAHREWSPFDRSIDIRVGRLRQKIEPDPQRPAVIKTVRGAGYVFVAG